MLETPHRERPEPMELDIDKVSVSHIISRRDTSPERAMMGEVIQLEEVDFKLTINGEEYTATLCRSDYEEDAPANYTIQLRPSGVILKNSKGQQINLDYKNINKLMNKLEASLKTEK